jgi:N-acetylmuramoyl-L-alanine amidase
MKITEIPGIIHFSERPSGIKIDTIVLHDTGGKTARSAIMWFLNPESKVSSHYIIDKDGTIYKCIPDSDKAWHAGVSSLHGRQNVNDFSLGIEIVDNNDTDPYPEPQLNAVIDLVVSLCMEYHVPLNRIVGHADVAPGRKTDPGKDFPWFDFLNTVGSLLSEKVIENG